MANVWIKGSINRLYAWHVGFDDYIYHGGWKSMFIYLDLKKIQLKKTWSNKAYVTFEKQNLFK